MLLESHDGAMEPGEIKLAFGRLHQGPGKFGNADISNYIQGQAPAKGNNYRVTHFNDVVPQLPEHTWGNDAWDYYTRNFGSARTRELCHPAT